jgi:Mg2+ and Co2+ transporter CorA
VVLRLGLLLTKTDTWTYFEVKQLFADMEYEWDKLNVFTRWVASTKQTFVIIFDLKSGIREELLKSFMDLKGDLLGDPYWPYPIILDSVARLEESAVWRIRDRVRPIETQEKPKGVPDPDYRKLHDIGRHAIHVSETLDVAVQTIESVQRRHTHLAMSKMFDQDPTVGQDVGAQLEFFRGFISNLRHRSISNEKRLQNEIQLAFNTVAQYNAGTSVAIGRAAQIDSSAMKTIAFVTLIFLPPTFISSVFSMSFFQCGVDNGWGMTNKFWIYWVFAIPTTVATVVVWQYWHNLFPGSDYNKPGRAVKFSHEDFEMHGL